MKKDDVILFDKRLQERNLRRGDITAKELQKYLKDLPDVSDNIEEPEKEEESESES